MYIANVCEYNILRFEANTQKYQTLVPARNSHLKVSAMAGPVIMVIETCGYGIICTSTISTTIAGRGPIT